MIQAYAAMEKGKEFIPYAYDPGSLGPHEVEIRVEHCGICHSDFSMWHNTWGITAYPFIGGHEISGTVLATGTQVTHIDVGDAVGLGWHKGYCATCDHCMSGDHNLCAAQQGTVIDNHGGFADRVRAQDISVIKIPDQLDLASAGPLLCGGITVFNPFVQYNIKPTDHVAVIGIGGLGHLALQFARAWGCEVTALTSDGKMQEARALGAHHCLNARDAKELRRTVRCFDLVLSTVNVQMDWNRVIAMLKPKGRLHFLGTTLAPADIAVFPLIVNQYSVSGTPVGAPATLHKMMAFAARHNIKPVTEHFSLSRINEAFAHLESGKARYRLVLDAIADAPLT